jgi:hypothetical protein
VGGNDYQDSNLILIPSKELVSILITFFNPNNIRKALLDHNKNIFLEETNIFIKTYNCIKATWKPNSQRGEGGEREAGIKGQQQ